MRAWCATRGAARTEDRSVQLEWHGRRCDDAQLGGNRVGGLAVQIVDVLGHDADAAAREREPRERQVRVVRPTARDDVAPPGVPLPDEPWIARERPRRRELLRA